MLRWQTVTGVVLGLMTALVILAFSHRGTTPAPSGPILSECDGHLRELVIQYEPSAKDIVAPVYREFLGALSGDVTVHVVCPNRAAFAEFTDVVAVIPCTVSPIIADHPITVWSRDRWVALQPDTPEGPTTIWSPRAEAAEEIWPARAGDERVGLDLATALAPSVRARRSDFHFDGGDFLADGENVFVVPRVLERNIQHTARSRDEFLQSLSVHLKRNVILLSEAPDHHAGMFMASVGNKTMLVGDPQMGKRWFADIASPSADTLPLPGGPDFRPETQRLYDAVAMQCADTGYKIVRMPVVPACDGRTFLTYVNVLIDVQKGGRVVFLPIYRGVEDLNAEARRIWEQLGYEVRPVDCTSTYRHFGSLHCLVNVLKRS